MTAIPTRPRAVVHEAGFLAALIVLAGLIAAQWVYASSDAPDWQGYQALYEGSADWLGPSGFMAVLAGARWLFGPDGYGLFRLALFGVFAGFAARLAYVMPVQRRLGWATALMTGGAVLASLGPKSVVQIREGLAFVVFLAGPVGALIAPLIHAGIAPLSAVWLVAWSPRRVPAWALTIASVSIGLALALLTIAHGDEVATYAASLGVDVSARVRGGWLKLGYWAALGGATWVLRARLADGDRFGEALGSGLLPAVYVFCAALVAAGFATPAVTSMGVRVLITAMDLALLRVCLRGRADVASAVVMVGMLCDELRLLAVG
jgi:hypothetical protein